MIVGVSIERLVPGCEQRDPNGAASTLNGLGKTARCIFTDKDHGRVTKETWLDLWARWAAWLDKYVKNPEKKPESRITTHQHERHRRHP